MSPLKRINPASYDQRSHNAPVIPNFRIFDCIIRFSHATSASRRKMLITLPFWSKRK